MPRPNGIRESRRAFASFFIIGVTTVTCFASLTLGPSPRYKNRDNRITNDFFPQNFFPYNNSFLTVNIEMVI